MGETINIKTPHLVPLPKGEETPTQLSVIFRRFCESAIYLASPLGRGARQRGEGVMYLRGQHDQIT